MFNSEVRRRNGFGNIERHSKKHCSSPFIPLIVSSETFIQAITWSSLLQLSLWLLSKTLHPDLPVQQQIQLKPAPYYMQSPKQPEPCLPFWPPAQANSLSYPQRVQQWCNWCMSCLKFNRQGNNLLQMTTLVILTEQTLPFTAFNDAVTAAEGAWFPSKSLKGNF